MRFFQFLFSKTFLINLLIAIAVVVILFFMVSSYLSSYTLHGESIKVPNLVDTKIEDVEELVKEVELKYVVNDSIYVKGKAAGIVLEQEPTEGREVKKGRKIYLTLTASFPPQTSVPDLVDRSMRQAEATLEAYGLAVGNITYQADPCNNCVLEQLIKGKKVEAGKLVNKGTAIDLVLGKGLSNEMVNFPYLYEMDAENAKVLLRASSLSIGIEEYDETVKTAEDSANAIIYRTIPSYSPNRNINAGSMVSIYLSLDKNKITPIDVDSTQNAGEL